MCEKLPLSRDQVAIPCVPKHLWLLRALDDYIPAAAYFVVDKDFRYLLAGGTALIGAGTNSGDFEGKKVADVVPADLLSQYLADYAAIFAGKNFVRKHPVGERLYTTHGKLIKGRPGTQDVALAISYDITHERAITLEYARLGDSTSLDTRPSMHSD